MLDADLAEIYGVTTKRLNEQVKRNRARFPNDFMFQLTKKEKDKELAHKLTQLERKIEKHDDEIKVIFEAIRQLMIPLQKPKKKIGSGREGEK